MILSAFLRDSRERLGDSEHPHAVHWRLHGETQRPDQQESRYLANWGGCGKIGFSRDPGRVFSLAHGVISLAVTAAGWVG